MGVALVLVAIFTLFWPSLGHADSTFRVHRIHLDEEHRSDYATDSLRDREGFLWTATDNGLKRYDGYHLRVFTHDPNRSNSIGSSSIRHLFLQSDGTLWAAGDTLNRYHPETESFTRYSFSNGNTIRAIHEDSHGILWVAGEGFGLIAFDPNAGTATHVGYGNSAHGRINVIAPHAPHGASPKIWLASDTGLYLFDTETHESLFYPLALDHSTSIEAIQGMEEDASGQLWIATLTGLLVLDPATGFIKHYSADPANEGSLSTNVLRSLLIDSNGFIWVGTDKMGVYRYVPETDGFSHFPASASDQYRLPPGPVMDIYEDTEGSLWFTVGVYGAYRLSPHLQKFKSFQSSFDSSNSLAFNNVLCLYEDRAGYVWIATDGGGLDRFDPKNNRFEHYRHDPDDPQSLSSDAVLAIAEDSKGLIWVGTWSGGLNRLDPETGKFHRIRRDPNKPKDQTLADDHIFRIVVDDNDRLLLAVARAGLQVYDPEKGTFESYSPDDEASGSGIRSHFINDILPTPDGNYWIAGYEGLEFFSFATRTFQPSQLQITDPISDLHLDDNGTLWIATNKNLTHYDPVTKTAEFFTVNDGLSDEYVVSIEQDSAGYLWLGTRRGLSRLDPWTKEVVVFDEQDGLSGTQFNRFSHLKARNGVMYFGGTNGFSQFDPKKIQRNLRIPSARLTSLEIDGTVQYPGLSPWLTHSINYTDALVLPSSRSNITFSFASTNFIAPSKNKYRYRLKGLNEEWQTVDGSRRFAHYSQLPPGKYLFQVWASNNDGVWSSRAKELSLTVLPSWWQTWWARSLYVVLILTAMYGFSYWRLRRNRAREKRLKVMVSEKTAELQSVNCTIMQLNSELEQRVAQRTHDLSVEVEERKESEARAHYIAYHDTLTGLYNRAWLLKHLDEIVRLSPSQEDQFALLFIGGDRFRRVNDTYGHLQGDLLLKAAAQRLVSLISRAHHAVRLGSDEFAVVMDSITSEAEAISLAERINRAFKESFLIERVRMNFSVSIGIVVDKRDCAEPSKSLSNANIAMQRAKDRGRGGCQIFDEDILQQTLDHAALETDLKLALLRDQFSVVYQPIIIAKTDALAGFEVLIRWRHPERGMVPPDKFIPMAESLGLIFDIGLWVLKEACEQLKAWQTELDLPVLPVVAVNLSPVQLEQTDFLERIDEVFRATGLNQSHIKFEITESALMKHTETVDGVLDAMRQRGIELAIDDFGTGYSSLSYLDKLPVQVLKIDRSFINALRGAEANSSAHEIVRATILLAHNLNMRVVAEGIETESQLDTLISYGCDYGQGYFIARPLSPEDAGRFLAEATVMHL